MAKELIRERFKKYNTYDLTGDYGIGYTLKGEIFLFDLKHYNKIKDYCWLKDSYGYLICLYKGKKQIKMHRFIMDAKDGEIVDHVNGKGSEFDNREENLRICTKAENSYNKKNVSGISVINLINDVKKWSAHIQFKNKRHHLGRFDTEEEAKEARRKAELEYYGEFARKIEEEE